MYDDIVKLAEEEQANQANLAKSVGGDEIKESKWKKAHDPNSGKDYYYHEDTKETRWTKPDDYQEPKAAHAKSDSVIAFEAAWGSDSDEKDKDDSWDTDNDSESDSESGNGLKNMKCVVVGDGAVGKTVCK